MQAPLPVGLVGAGPWASVAHAPMLAAGPHTELAGIWARRPEAAEELARRHGTRAFGELDALLEACEAVAFAVPPDVQPELAARAARAGKAILLEKPLALSPSSARSLTDAVDEASVGSMMVLTWRFAPVVREFIATAASEAYFGGRARFISGGLLRGSEFATSWRLEHGPLFDLGPHVLDLLDAALGRIVSVHSALGDAHGLSHLALEHEGGATSVASLCGNCAVDPSLAGAELFGPSGRIAVDCKGLRSAAFPNIAAEFALAAREREHPLDIHHGLRLQELLAEAQHSLATS
ncbi:MAG: Gfo/Idh/MocA family protein [Acidimicrobiales bacterium]